MNPFIRINGKEFPSPSVGLKFLGSQIVDSARTASGVAKSAKINRRQIKLEPLSWDYLKADDWENILQEIVKFDGVLEFYSPHYRSWVRMQVYWGDDSGEILFLDPATNKPESYTNCGCNLVDKGEPLEFI